MTDGRKPRRGSPTCSRDSTGFLNFVAALHEATGVDTPERDYALIDTLTGCIDYLRRRGAPR